MPKVTIIKTKEPKADAPAPADSETLTAEVADEPQTGEGTEKAKPQKAVFSKPDKVRVRFLKSMAAPQIGTFDFQTEFGRSAVLANQEFVVPRSVASHLHSTKAAVILA